MKASNHREFSFALIMEGVSEISEEIENALFEAGCDDATFSIQQGRFYGEFSRTARSIEDAILSAIRDIRKADIGAHILRVDDCDLVSQSEIARRVKRSRQAVGQFISGKRGPGRFPAPECHLRQTPLWSWQAASKWFEQNDLVNPEQTRSAVVIAAINNALEAFLYQTRNPKLVREIANVLAR